MRFGSKSMLCTALPTLENALLWTMRAWVIGRCRNRDTAGRIAEVFGKLGAPACARHLDGFMTALGRGAIRCLEVNCVCHPEVSDDEAVLLEIFALQQQEHYDEAYELLAGMTTEFSAAAGCDSANQLALALRDAGQGLSVNLHAVVRFRDRASDPFELSQLTYLH
jgi:hypothetical protein